MDRFLLQAGLIKSANLKNHSLVSFDSRDLVVGQIFFALPGKNTDGHNYILTAAAKGAAAAVVSKPIKNCPIPQMVVENTTESLVQYAINWRDTVDPHCFGITGSNGKTTVRAMIQHVLEKLNASFCASAGNNNNELGVPLTILKLRDTHTHAVFEMGARGMNQIKQLVDLVRPNIGVLTNVSECHLEGFGSLDNIIKAKSELFSNMTSGYAVVNADSNGARYFIAQSEHLQVVTYGSDPNSVDFGFDEIINLQNNRVRFSLHYCSIKVIVDLAVSGIHNVYNAVAAIAALSTSGLDIGEIVEAIGSFAGVPRRLMPHTTPFGMFVIDDSYNASPASFKIALAQLQRHISKNKCIVCGDMAELGASSGKIHQRLLQEIKQLNFKNVILYGNSMHVAGRAINFEEALYPNNYSEMLDMINKYTNPGDVVLVKGSRFLQLDKLVDELLMEPTE